MFFLKYLTKAKYYIAFIALLLYCDLRAQDPLLDRAQEFIHTNPDETIKIGELLLTKEQYEPHYNNINLWIAKSHHNKGNYALALQHLFATGEQVLSSDFKFKVLLIKADILRNLHLHKQCDLYLEQAQDLLANHKVDEISLKETAIAKIKIRGLLNKEKDNETNNIWERADKKYDYSDDNFTQKWLLLKANILESTQQTDSMEYYYEKVLSFGYSGFNKIQRLEALVGLSKVYFEREEYARAIDTLLKCEKEAGKLEHPFLLADIENQLSNNYLAVKEQENQNQSYSNFLMYKTNSEKAETDAVNTFYNLVTQEYEQVHDSQTAVYNQYFIFSLWGLTLLVFVGIVFLYKYRLKIKRFEEILKYLKASSSIPLKQPVLEKKKQTKKTTIPTETEQYLLSKLKEFEQSDKFITNDMSLANLASQLETNTKYLSEVINKHYNDNFNMYINRLRVNYIIEKLKTDSNYRNYKISYLAEQCGFSSHSSFATVFKAITGIAPTTFITLMQKENQHKEQEV